MTEDLAHPPWTALHALRTGLFGVSTTLLIALALTAVVTISGDTVQAVHWLAVFPRTFELLKTGQMFSPRLTPEEFQAALESIFILAVLVSVFAQYTVQDFFIYNDFYRNTVLRVWWPELRIHGGARLSWKSGWVAEGSSIAESFIVNVTLSFLAAMSVFFVGMFAIHLCTTVAYVLLILAIDFIYYLVIGDSPRVRSYRGITARALFRELNRQLLIRIDCVGVLALSITPIIIVVRGFANAPTLDEETFFTGIISFYLIATFILIVDLLSDWNRILNRKSIVDSAVLPSTTPPTVGMGDTPR